MFVAGLAERGFNTISLQLLFLRSGFGVSVPILLMDKILHDPKDPKLWELWYIPYNG